MFRTTSIAVIAFLFSPLIHATEFSGRVVAISDGDTLTPLTPEKKQIKVRLDSIDALDKGQSHGNAARQALAEKVFEKDISVSVKATDHYGRIVGTVNFGQRNINRELVEEGHAWAYRQYLKDPYMIEAEDRARLKNLGLWRLQNDQIQAPWEWRKEVGSTKGGVTAPRVVKNEISKSAFKCGQKNYCKEMSSCEEAMFFLKSRGVTTIDGDKDGIPCEKLCRQRAH